MLASQSWEEFTLQTKLISIVQYAWFQTSMSVKE